MTSRALKKINEGILIQYFDNKLISNEPIIISGSKSESNRLLLLQGIFGRDKIVIENLSNAEDTKLFEQALYSNSDVIDVKHAGTAMRFLTAYFSMQVGINKILTGSKRMKERPIGILVDALRQLGASITYLEKEGHPPLKIKGERMQGGMLRMASGISSQYISALLLIATQMPMGVWIELHGKITSLPYINMTLSILEQFGFSCGLDNSTKRLWVRPSFRITKKSILVESDWSSASYFYGLVALSKEAQVRLGSFSKNSLQGDSKLVKIYRLLGVETKFNEDGTITLSRAKNFSKPRQLILDLNDNPDIAQTLAVSCVGLKIPCLFKGLETLNIKETNRLKALEIELQKLGACVSISYDTLQIRGFENTSYAMNIPEIKTYNDHRMAMAFATYGLICPIFIEKPEVVNKSYPNFWNDLKKIGFRLEKIAPTEEK